MKINRFMQVVLVSGAVSLVVPALASSMPSPSAPSTLCDGDSDDDKDEKDDKEGETLCGGDSDDDDKDEKDDKEGETLCGGDSDDDDKDEKDDKEGEETARL